MDRRTDILLVNAVLYYIAWTYIRPHIFTGTSIQTIHGSVVVGKHSCEIICQNQGVW